MVKFKAVVNTVNLLTGATTRHNRGLRDLKEWMETVREYLLNYKIFEQPEGAYVLEKSGDAKFDLTSLVYKARPMPAIVKNIRGHGISRTFTDVVESLEAMRRTLIDQTSQAPRLANACEELRESFEKLRVILDDVDFI